MFVPSMFHLPFVPLSLSLSCSLTLISVPFIHPQFLMPFFFQSLVPFFSLFLPFRYMHSFLSLSLTNTQTPSLRFHPSLAFPHTHILPHTLVRHCDSSLAQSGLRLRLRSIPCWPVWVTVRGNHPLHTHKQSLFSNGGLHVSFLSCFLFQVSVFTFDPKVAKVL